MTEPTALACLPPGLTNEEAEFIYNVEVLDLPTRKAAQLAGLPYKSTGTPLIKQARALVRDELRGNLQVTKEDATYGLKEAINRARLFGEPMTEIAGWDRLIKLHGLDEPQKININLTASLDALKTQVRSMSDSDLLALAGGSEVIDAEFYEVRDGQG